MLLKFKRFQKKRYLSTHGSRNGEKNGRQFDFEVSDRPSRLGRSASAHSVRCGFVTVGALGTATNKVYLLVLFFCCFFFCFSIFLE